MNNRSIFSLIGILLFLTGFVAIILSLVGLNLSLLSWLEDLGKGVAFLVKIIMVLFGIIILYLSKTTEPE